MIKCKENKIVKNLLEPKNTKITVCVSWLLSLYMKEDLNLEVGFI